MQPRTIKKARIKPVSGLSLKKPMLPLPYVQLTVSTWQKDSHGLYDYEAPDNMCEVEVLNITKSCKIFKHASNARILILDDADPRSLETQFIYIATVVINRESQMYQLQSAAVSGVQPHQEIREEHPDIFNNSFLVVKTYNKDHPVEGYPLAPGNVIRLGRIEYFVLEIRNENTTTTYKQTSHLQLNTANYIVDRPLEGSCKICLCEESTEEDPLISPCICKGSCEFIHVGCLKNWINSKVKKELSDIVLSYNFSKFQCEICKAPFPKTVTMGDKILDMISIDKPDKPYIMLETVNAKEDTKRERNVHMIFSNEGQALKIGRGHQCEMRVNDISVSRTHAQVKFQNNKFYLKDSKSKFGTLIKFMEQLEVRDGVKLQYGRVCLELNMRRQQPKLKQEHETMDEDLFDQ